MSSLPSRLTERQVQVLNFIEDHVERSGYPPTHREIASAFGFRSSFAAKQHLEALQRKGYLSTVRGRARAIEMEGHPRARSVPIVGEVAAGVPLLSEENLVGRISLDRRWVRSKNSFLLKVQGESMKERGILPGDYVLVRAQPSAESGDIVVALVEGEATVKEFIRRGRHVILRPANPAYSPMIFRDSRRDLRIVGKVTGVVRLFGEGR